MANRHRFDPGAPITGLCFLVVAGYFLASALAGESLLDLSFVSAAVFIGLGAVGMVRVLSMGRRREVPPGRDTD